MHLNEVPRVVKSIDRQWNISCQGPAGRGVCELVFNGYRIAAWDEGKVLEMDDSDGCTTIQMFLMALNCAVRNGYSGYSP